MELYIIRHGKTYWNEEKKDYPDYQSDLFWYIYDCAGVFFAVKRWIWQNEWTPGPTV